MAESCRCGMGIEFALAGRCRRVQELLLPARRVRLCGQALVPRSSRPESLREAFCGGGVRVRGPVAGEQQWLRARNCAGARLSVRAGKRTDCFSGHCRADVHVRLRFLELNSLVRRAYDLPTLAAECPVSADRTADGAA